MRQSSDIYASAEDSAPLSARDNSRVPITLKPRSSTRNYDFGQDTRFTGDFSSASLSADQAVFMALQTTRNRARDLEANHPLVRKFLIMLRTNVVGSKGMRFQSLAGDRVKDKIIPDKMARSIIEQAYRAFSKAKLFSQNHKLSRRRAMQVIVSRVIVDGECIIQKIRGADNPHLFTTKLIDVDLLDHRLNAEATRTRGRIIMGIEVDEQNDNRPVAYYFRQQPLGLWGGEVAYPGDHVCVPADEIIHYFNPERPGQTRGITFLAPAGIRAKLLDGMEQSVLVGYRAAASKMGFLSPNEFYEGEDLEAGDVPTEVAPGQIDLLPKGIDFKSFDPSYPNADFDVIKKSVTKEIAGALGVSYPELGNDYGGVSYAAGQIGVDADEKVWRDFQATLIEVVEEEIFEGWLSMQLLFGKLPFPLARKGKFLAHRFQPTKGRTIDPLKTAKTHELKLHIGGTDPYEIADAYGNDLEELLENTARAIETAEALGLTVPPAWTGGVSGIEPTKDEPQNIE